MPYGRPWTIDEDTIGKQMLADGKKYAEVALALNRTYIAIYHRNKKRWKVVEYKPHWNSEEEGIAKQLLSAGLPYSKVARRIGRTAVSIRTKNYRDWHISNMKPRKCFKSTTRSAGYSERSREKRDFSGKRKTCLNRDNWTCQQCGVYDPSGSILAIHHKDQQGRGTSCPNNSLSNLVTLCMRCHATAHKVIKKEVQYA